MRTGMRPYSRKASPRQRFAGMAHAGAPGDRRGLFAAMLRYIEHRAMLGSSEQGIYGVERCVRDFIVWADARGVTHPQQVSRPVLERYQRWLFHYRKKDGEPLNVRSQRGKIIPLRGFFKWLTRTGEIPANPAADLDLPRQIKRLPRNVLSIEEAERVMAGADLGSVIGLRDRAMMEVLYATGMRRMEIAGLAIEDVEAERAVVLIRQGKGQKDRLIPLGERALHWVHKYLDEARPQLVWNEQDRTLFLGNEGLPLSPTWLSTVITQYVTKAQIGKRGGCHLWRHTMATLMLEGGADIRFIQAMLGHADISSTQIYTQVAVRQLSQVHAMTHPGALRRRRSVQAAEDVPTPCPDPQTAAADLLDALDEEAQDEDPDDAAAEAT
jgi:integrase/recombinase XerD